MVLRDYSSKSLCSLGWKDYRRKMSKPKQKYPKKRKARKKDSIAPWGLFFRVRSKREPKLRSNRRARFLGRSEKTPVGQFAIPSTFRESFASA
jgi:hypothetical protein